MTIQQELRKEELQRRYFIIQGPNGVLIDISTSTQPSLEFLPQFLEDAVPAQDLAATPSDRRLAFPGF